MHRRTYHCCRLWTVVHHYGRCEKKKEIKMDRWRKVNKLKKFLVNHGNPSVRNLSQPLTVPMKLSIDILIFILTWYYIDENHILLFFHHYFFWTNVKAHINFSKCQMDLVNCKYSMNIQTNQTLPHAFLNLHLCKVFTLVAVDKIQSSFYTPPSCVILEAITKQLINLKQLFTIASHNSAEPSLCGGGTN